MRLPPMRRPRTNAEEHAGCASKWTLSYMDALLSKGIDITKADVGRPRKGCESRAVEQRFMREWAIESKKPNPSLFAAQLRSIQGGYGRFAKAIGFYLLEAVLQLVPVLALRLLVSHFQELETDDDGANNTGGLKQSTLWILVGVLYAAPTLGSLFRARYDVEMVHAGCEMATASSLALYKKALRALAPAAKLEYATGKVVNLFSSDAVSVQKLLSFIGILVAGPVQIVVCLFFIYVLVGEAMWIGLAFMIMCIPLQLCVLVPYLMLQKQYLKCSDERTKLMNEVLAGVRIIKFLAWEEPFRKKLLLLRDAEARVLRKQAYIISIGFAVVMLGAPIIQPVVIFTYYTQKMGKTLDASTAFSTLALFSLLRLPLAFLPFVLINFLVYRVSCKRITNFLNCAELKVDVETLDCDFGGIVARLDAASFAWDPAELVNAPEALQIGNDEDEAPSPVDTVQTYAALTAGKRPSFFSRKSTNSFFSRTKKFPGAEAPGVAVRQPTKQSAKSAQSKSEEKEEEDVEAPQRVMRVTLDKVTLTIRAGDLVGVVGPVGSGKSSLLSAILGEVDKVGGTLARRPGTAALATQVPWVINATLRDNITFGEEFDQERFDSVVQSCALADDIKQLPGGVECEIGERGINLSGGQKARIALARVTYCRSAAVVLLDDPLSAVDSHVCKHLVDFCLDPMNGGDVGGTLFGRTRVLVTHHAAVLPRCDVVVVMKDGAVVATGSYDALAAAGVEMGELKAETADEDDEEFAVADEAGDTGAELGDAPVVAVAVPLEASDADGRLVVDESAMRGRVATKVWVYFVQSGGYGVIVFALIFMFGGRGAELAGQFYLAGWSRRTKPGEAAVTQFINFYLMFALLAVAGLGGRGYFLAMHRVRAANVIHQDLVTRVLRAPVSFFDVTPLGRILNRFGADMLTVDSELSRTMSEFCGTVMYVLGAVVAIAVATQGIFVVMAVPLIFIYRRIDRTFRGASTALSRLAKQARSPVLADFSETLNGVGVIRAYGASERFVTKLCRRLDDLTAAATMEQQAFNWLTIRLDQLAALTAASVAALAVASDGKLISPEWLGLALTAAIEISTFLKQTVKLSSVLASNMASVERIQDYAEHVPQERDVALDQQGGKTREDGWAIKAEAFAPTTGGIVFDRVEMRYRQGPLVLKAISFSVPGGSKVGIVGRTGSGKSSIANALWRIVEAESGAIRIDGVDIASLPLFELRRACFIIPQDPVLFTATLKFNVDPFDEYSVEAIWDALDKVHMAAYVRGLKDGLSTQIQEGGSNLSVGQRQLVCISRALLRSPKIIMLDEATASIDNDTDALVQKTLRETFFESTTLTIAHRLHTILDADALLVLADGAVVEQGAPADLLNTPGGFFQQMHAASKKKAPNGAPKAAPIA